MRFFINQFLHRAPGRREDPTAITDLFAFGCCPASWLKNRSSLSGNNPNDTGHYPRRRLDGTFLFQSLRKKNSYIGKNEGGNNSKREETAAHYLDG